jgi:hypothetical protein
MAKTERAHDAETEANTLASRLAYHLRCLREDATDHDLSSGDWLVLVRERVRMTKETCQKLVTTAEAPRSFTWSRP